MAIFDRFGDFFVYSVLEQKILIFSAFKLSIGV
jgi:hypothetical protein